MENNYYIILKFLVLSICFAAVDATTEDGQKVILHNDGTWKFENPAESAKFNLIEFVDSHFEKHEKHYGRDSKPFEAHVRGFFQFQNNSDKKVVAIKYKFSLIDAFDEALYESIVKDNIIIDPGKRNKMDTYYYWEDTFVAFAIGCSFTFEHELLRNNLELDHIKQIGPTCVPTTLAMLARSTGADVKPEDFMPIINSQSPHSWSKALEQYGMQLAYCNNDLRRLEYYIDELVQHDDLFLLCFYSQDPPFDPDINGKLCTAHIVTLHKDVIIDTAKKNKINFQKEVASRATGTDTDAFAFSIGGVCSALISLPLRYMHTTVETVHRDDVEGVIKLIYNTYYYIKKFSSII